MDPLLFRTFESKLKMTTISKTKKWKARTFLKTEIFSSSKVIAAYKIGNLKRFSRRKDVFRGKKQPWIIPTDLSLELARTTIGNKNYQVFLRPKIFVWPPDQNTAVPIKCGCGYAINPQRVKRKCLNCHLDP